MSGTTVLRGNLSSLNLYSLTLSPVSVAANTTATQTFTINALALNDWVDLTSNGAQQAGLSIGNVRVSAVNTLEVSFTNDTGSPITPTAGGSYLFVHGRSEYNPLQVTP